jgi:hypothetical protein
MNRLMLLMALILITGKAGSAQSFEKGSHAINLGIGFWNTAYLVNGHYSGFYPSAAGSYEYGLAKNPMGSRLTGVLGIVGYAGVSFTDYYSSSAGDYYLRRDILVGIGCNYHFIFHDKLDVYSGAWVGADIRDYKWKGAGDAPEEVDFTLGSPYGGVYFGIRWFFIDHLAIYAETGGLASLVNAGATFKF